MFSRRNQKMLVLSTALVALLSFANTQSTQQDFAFCSCPENPQMDRSLPMSHPVNRCATQEASGVSWASWFSGSNNSKQFHYLDLLELLSRFESSSEQQGHSATS